MSNATRLRLIARYSAKRHPSIDRMKRDFAEGQTTLNKINEGTVELLKKRGEMESFAASSLDLLSIIYLTRIGTKNLIDMASGRGGIGDMISFATTLAILYVQINSLMNSALAKQALLALGLTGPQAAVLAIGLGVGLGAIEAKSRQQNTRRATTVIDRRGLTSAYRRLSPG